MAFMDIDPIQDGMIVVVPKQQIPHFEDLSEDLTHALIKTAQKLMRALRKTFPNKKKIALIIEGLDLPDHVHVKLIPASSGAELNAKPPGGDPDHDTLAALAERIKENL